MSTAVEAWPQRHRISADEYCRMAEIGLLPPDARVELIDGEILDMPTIGKDHESVVDQLTHMFVRAVDELAIFFRSLHAGKYREKASTAAPGVTPVAALPQVSVDLARLVDV